MRRCLSLTLAVVLLACAGILERSRVAKEGVIGISGRQLRSCLGLPYYNDGPPEREIWAYYRPLWTPQQEVGIQLAAEGTATAVARPQVYEGKPASISADDTRDLTLLGSVPPGTCRLAFELEESVVRRIGIRGRTRTDMNADAECALFLEPCVPPLR